MNIPTYLHLKSRNQPGRRVGITRLREPVPKAINVPAKTLQDIMLPKAASKGSPAEAKKVPVKLKQEDEEDVNRLPDSSSSDDRASRDIKPTPWGSSKAKDASSAKGGKQAKATVNSLRDTNGNYKGTARPRSTRGKETPSSNASTSGPKRKSWEEYGSSMQDAYGFTNTKPKKKLKGYASSSQSRLPSSQKKVAKKKSDPIPDSPKTKFKRPSPSPESFQDWDSPRKLYQTPQYDGSPDSTPRSAQKKFKDVSLTPTKEEKEQYSVFQVPEFDSMDDSLNMSFSDSDKALQKKLGKMDSAKLKQAFKTYGLDDSSIEAAQAMAREAKDSSSAPPVTSDDDEQAGLCPMCKAPIDPAEIKALGNMNIRMQEKFCRAHRKKSALGEWESKKYPTIDWESLDSRITRHHALIKELICGTNSHYRGLMEEKVKTGKDRSLMKMTSNLTPGYYGARGLRAISENIMHKFTPLLKKQIVEDKLMSARGVTPYVQSVLVPEVTCLLIMEDMDVTLERARDILTESVDVGELLNEEIRDVVRVRRVYDSEEEEDDDNVVRVRRRVDDSEDEDDEEEEED